MPRTASSRTPPNRDVMAWVARERWTTDITKATWALFGAGFVLQSVIASRQLATLDSRCEGGFRAHKVLASLTLSEIQTFSLVYAIPMVVTLCLVAKGESRGARIGGLLSALLSVFVAFAFALSAGAQGMCWMAGW